MWLPERLQEVSLFVLERDVEAVTDVVLRSASLHLEEVESETWAPQRRWSELAGRASALARRARDLLDDLALEPGQDPDEPVRPGRELDGLEAELASLEVRVAELRQRLEAQRNELDALELARSQLQLLSPVRVPVESLGDLRHLHLVLGTMPAENLTRVAAALFSIAFVLTPVQVRAGRALVAAASTFEDAAVLDRALRSAFFEPAPLPTDRRGLPQQALADLDGYVDEVRRHGVELRHERDRLADALRDRLLPLEARLRRAAAAADAIRRYPSRGEVYLIAGWVPERQLAAFAGAVRAAAEAPVVLEQVPPGASRQGVPTLLSTPRWLRPFTGLVTTFGLSGYRELDPTAPAAITFVVMVGMMFGDVGHGLILAALGGVWWLRARSPLAVVVVAAGLSGTVFGTLYGTVLGAPRLPALWLRPLYSIQELLLASIAAGVVVLNVGFALNLVGRARARDWQGLLIDKSGVAGWLLYWTLLGGGGLVLLGRLPASAVLLPAALLAALLWLREPLMARLARRRAEPLGESLVTGFFELFEAVLGYASNSLSFVRLGAFAVAHEGLSAMVLRYGSEPGGWFVLLVGTALIVGFEGMVVGIQALRLEYFEFFGRFFHGDGTPFVPISYQGGHDARTRS